MLLWEDDLALSSCGMHAKSWSMSMSSGSRRDLGFFFLVLVKAKALTFMVALIRSFIESSGDASASEI